MDAPGRGAGHGRVGLPWVWGATAHEVRERYGCDAGLRPGDDRLVRAITVDAEPEVVFDWLGNLRVAPYSYDWLDNLGRRSPRHLRDDLGPWQPGHRVMQIFEAEGVEEGRSVTIRMRPGPGRMLFGDVRVTYAVSALEPGGASRLVAVLRFRATGGTADAVRRRVLAWGDLLMMRKQLRTLRDLAQGRS